MLISSFQVTVTFKRDAVSVDRCCGLTGVWFVNNQFLVVHWHMHHTQP